MMANILSGVSGPLSSIRLSIGDMFAADYQPFENLHEVICDHMAEIDELSV
jgi:hypothetical protein